MCFVDYKRSFNCVNASGCGKCSRKMGISEHLIVLMRNIYTCQEAIYDEVGSRLAKEFDKAVY